MSGEMAPLKEASEPLLATRPSILSEQVFLDFQSAPVHEKGGGTYRCVHLPDSSMVLWNLPAGALLPEHEHPHRQITFMISGEYHLRVGDIESVNRSPSISVIPGNTVHSGKAITDCVVLDIFTPARPDAFEGGEMGKM